MLPAKCTVLHNSAGTASGMWFERKDTIFVSMPGVPFEMEAIMTEEVFPRLIERGISQSIVHKTVLTIGLPESMLAEKIESWRIRCLHLSSWLIFQAHCPFAFA